MQVDASTQPHQLLSQEVPRHAASHTPDGPAFLSKFRSRIPLTMRGAIILLICAYLVGYLAWRQNDIVAAVVGLFLLCVVLGSALITYISAKNFETSLTGQLFADSFQEGAPRRALFSRQQIRFVMRLSPLRILPGFILKFRVKWPDFGVSITEHVLRGVAREERLIVEDGAFPHRGRWIPEAVVFSFGDRLGLSHLAWESSHFFSESEFTVAPERAAEGSLPLLSSSSRQGDELPAINERQGDLYDLKPYHPSDGMRKVLWKVYAKSGQLIARHPEKSMSPEGKTAMFIFARKNDDALCGQTLTYLARLEDLGIALSVGCQGMRKTPPAISSLGTEDLLIESVWDSEPRQANEAVQEASTFLKSLKEAPGGENLEKIVAPVANSYFLGADPLSILVSSLRGLSDASTKPVVLLERSAPAFARGAYSQHPLSEKLRRLLFIRRTPRSSISMGNAGSDSSRFREEFLAVCARENWEVLFI